MTHHCVEWSTMSHDYATLFFDSVIQCYILKLVELPKLNSPRFNALEKLFVFQKTKK